MHPRVRQRQSGFTYIGLLAAIVVMGMLLTMASHVWSFSEQRDKEVQLLYVGGQYRMAIASYFAFGHRYPPALQDLLADNRFPVPKRHLRQLYRDPMTNDADWVLIADPTGVGIMGVASKSKLTPIKRKGFAAIEFGFEDSDCYCDWKFVYVPRRGAYPYQGDPFGGLPPLGPAGGSAPPAPGATPSPAPGVPLPTPQGGGR
jgi:type II secretory pathway pseudopilin PulG